MVVELVVVVADPAAETISFLVVAIDRPSTLKVTTLVPTSPSAGEPVMLPVPSPLSWNRSRFGSVPALAAALTARGYKLTRPQVVIRCGAMQCVICGAQQLRLHRPPKI